MLTAPRQRELSAPELAVLKAAAAGLTVADTALKLERSVETVKSHRKNLLRALDAVNMAHAVGLAFARGILGKPQQLPEEPITPGQIRAFHGKCSALDSAWHDERGTAKRDALARASESFGRQIESVDDLTEREASQLLDHLEALLSS